MYKIATATLAVALLVGCASNQPEVYQSPYCYTDQHIETKNGTVSSTTNLECTDRPSRQAEIQRAGIDRGCEEFVYHERRWGERIKVRGVRCEKFDGSWEIININGNFR